MSYSASGSPVGLKVLDVVDAQTPLLAGLPTRLNPHAHPHVSDLDLLNQVQERDVGAVEQYVGRDIRRLDALPGERDVDDDGERRHRALVRQLDEVVQLEAGGRIGFLRREVHLAVAAGTGAQQLAVFQSAQKGALRSDAVCWISMLLGDTKMVTGSRSSEDGSTDSSVSPSAKYAIIGDRAAGLSSIQCACTPARPC